MTKHEETVDFYEELWNKFLAKCDDPNDSFNKLLERIYNAPLSQKVSN